MTQKLVQRICVFILMAISNLPYTFAQKRDCYTDTYFENEAKSNHGRLKIMDQIERQIRHFENSSNPRSEILVTIPVVIHIVYNDPSENISTAQINSQIDVLNKDFRRLNNDTNNTWQQAADTGIEFCLATVDPSGKSTNGITRTYTNVSSFASSGDLIKYTSKGGKDAWPAEKYLNIWVGDISGTVLGYAQFPGGKSETDGVVIDYKVFGTGTKVTPGFHLGRTTTHEVGHWLNLKHIWGSSDCTTDDLVSDTPKSDAPNYGCAKGHWSCGSVDMVENYMDYSDDTCLNLFTTGQKIRMQALFATGGFRESITKSNGCGIPDQEIDYCGRMSIHLQFDNYPQETSWDIKDSKGLVVLKSAKYISSQKNSFLKIDTCFLPGCYTFNIYDSYSDGICCKYGKGSYRVYEGETVIAEGGSFTKSSSHSFCIINNAPTCTDGLKNGTETGIDCGGSKCEPCISCYDGIKNGSETGIDCGGAACVPCPDPVDSSGTSNGYLIASYFETGWDGWTGGATDTERYRGDFSREGDYSIMIRDDSGEESTITSAALDIRNFAKVKFEFSFYSYSMEKDEEFQLHYYDGQHWNLVKRFISGTDFYNNNFYDVHILIEASKYKFIQHGKFRFQCIASTNSDQIYIDAVKISGISGGAKESHSLENISAVAYYIGPFPDEAIPAIDVFPNPVDDIVNITSNIEIIGIKFIDLNGKVIKEVGVNNDHFTTDTSWLIPGLHVLNIQTENAIILKRMVKK